MARHAPPHPPQQQCLPMELPIQSPEARMRELFAQRWSLWHRAKTYEDAVADPTTRRLLELAALHSVRHAITPRGRR